MNLHKIIDYLYSLSPFIYDWQLNFFNGNHFVVLKDKLRKIPNDTIFEIGCGTAPILKVFNPSLYVGVDIESRFIKLARNIYKNRSNYRFSVGDGREAILNKTFDIVLFSHTTHHLTDQDIKNLLLKIKDYKFKHIVIYDGRPVGFFAPILKRMDYKAAKFRKTGDFMPLIGNNYKIDHLETFRANRPFYEYQLLILSKNNIK